MGKSVGLGILFTVLSWGSQWVLAYYLQFCHGEVSGSWHIIYSSVMGKSVGLGILFTVVSWGSQWVLAYSASAEDRRHASTESGDLSVGSPSVEYCKEYETKIL